NVKFAAADFGGERGPKSLQLLWRFPDGWHASLLISGREMVPAVVIGRLQADFVARISIVDGTLVASRLSHPDMAVEGVPALQTQVMSERYPLAMTVTVPSTALWRSYRELFIWGNAGGIVL